MEELAAAVEIYCHAGETALQDHVADAGWWQAHLEFTAWDQAEHFAAVHLQPQLHDWSINGLLDRWWFIRKAPCWRVRLRPHPASSREALVTTAAAFFDRLVVDGHLARWQPTHYEPETLAFGGPIGITIAHDLFSADTRNLLAYLRAGETPMGRRELSLLLCTALFRAARQEGFEAGDIWHRVGRLRPDPDHASTDTRHHATLTTQLRTLLSYDIRLSGPLFGPGGPLAMVRPWAEAFHDAGQALAVAAAQSNLHRGLRAILAHHVIFHWNRLGLDATTQHALAHAATGAILQRDP
ncbi:thiopeptide-type bacteriocin biosynthesis protein [Amycolatopsis rhizosphaerae]|uniref:thiopeptide-type bacteriocin biosynthesis protein n=1 Tax=Amycolatopsis rhizosphaerae TaxID=2053003 RepID=UPI001FEBF1BB|nr:thiopeptide-type bacteriocin biosynthesis protein [Amycolatopsis rhizosphaerae]